MSSSEDVRDIVRNYIETNIVDIEHYDYIDITNAIVSNVECLKDDYSKVKHIVKELYPNIVGYSECELDSDDGIMMISEDTANNIDMIIDYNTVTRFQYNKSYAEIGIPLVNGYIAKRMEEVICEYVADQIREGLTSYVKIRCEKCGNVNEHYDIPVRVRDHERTKRIRICPSCWTSKVL